ncbi:MAG: monovalent cation/H(+) antiporter subunit G [Bacteroidales bacterium]|nr:monovalent cation/H(+) antiporter subunit G [Bacteroidales bacterium]MDZ4203778.1 monovalent cation/H(+) antiporter subunit G [Bacteroidales bacterium]
MNETISIILIIIGLMFNLFGCIGLIRLPDVYNRLQSATKCVTLGTWCILAALLVRYGFNEMGVKALISIPLLFLASTVAAHSLVRGSYHYGIKMWNKSVKDEYGPDVEKENKPVIKVEP